MSSINIELIALILSTLLRLYNILSPTFAFGFSLSFRVLCGNILSLISPVRKTRTFFVFRKLY